MGCVVSVSVMVRSGLFAGVLALAALGSPDRALAFDDRSQEAVQAVLQPLILELQRDGYSRIETGWTWLGRLYVTAWRDGREREIVIHPTSGEVLRDILGPATVQVTGLADQPDGSGAGAIAGPDGETTAVLGDPGDPGQGGELEGELTTGSDGSVLGWSGPPGGAVPQTVPGAAN